MTTKISGVQIQNFTIETSQLSNTAVAAFAQSLAPKITSVNVANSAYTILDDTAVNVGGGYIVITGSDFQSGASVLIDAVSATSVTYVNTSTLRAEVPARSAATYNLYVVNPDGGTGIRVNGLTYSGVPTWVTTSPLSNQQANTSFNVSLSATSATSYSNTTALPAGTTLLANGYFFGTVTIGAETTYTFTVRATDAENQDADRTFQVTVTVTPQYQLFLWGKNDIGQLGLNERTNRSSPTQVGSLTDWNKISIGTINPGQFPVADSSSSFAVKNNGTLWSWGDNKYGQLGHSDLINRSSPVQVGSSTNWNDIETSSLNIVATKTDGTLWVWGYNGYGQLGQNSTIDRSSPVQVGSSTSWNKISVGKWTILATKTDGTLWSWGNNSLGTLGIGNIVNQSSPIQIGSSTNWNNVDTNENASISTKTDGTLWTWGYNYGGFLGLNDQVNRSSPVQVGSSTNWNLVSVGGRYSALSSKTDGTLWSWGNSGSGQLGLGDATYRSSPTQIGSSTSWSKFSKSLYHNLAIKTDGTLWTWGYNSEGQLGINDRVYKSSPTQVGSGTTWFLVNVGGYSSIALKQV